MKRNFCLDLAILTVFLITTTTGLLLWLVIPHQAGVVFLCFSRRIWAVSHIYSGMAGIAVIVIHIAWHWDWLKAWRGRPFRRMSEKARANRIVDRVMWIIFIGANLFGFVEWAIHFGDAIYVTGLLIRLHVVLGIAWVLFTTVHLALHWEWIVRPPASIPLGIIVPIGNSSPLWNGGHDACPLK